MGCNIGFKTYLNRTLWVELKTAYIYYIREPRGSVENVCRVQLFGGLVLNRISESSHPTHMTSPTVSTKGFEFCGQLGLLVLDTGTFPEKRKSVCQSGRSSAGDDLFPRG